MAENRTVEISGRPIRDGETVIVDHTVKSFHVVLRSLGGVGVQDLIDHIQKKYEVVDLKEVGNVTFVHGTQGD